MLTQIATFFGVGRIPKAPGTWGTLFALPLVFVLMRSGVLIYMAATLAITLLGIVAADHYEKQSSKHDSKEIVIDEVIGILVTMTLLPMTWQAFAAGFILFRFLDILKPFPISHFDRKVPGGFGVVVDDVVAGMIANMALHLLYNYNAAVLGGV